MGVSPLALIYGRRPVLPTEISLPDIMAENQTLEDQFASLIQGQELAWEIASQALPAAQAAMKRKGPLYFYALQSHSGSG